MVFEGTILEHLEKRKSATLAAIYKDASQASQLHREPLEMDPRQIVVRGYVKQVGRLQFVGVCLTLNLVVQGESQDEALDKLQELIKAYLCDALDKNELDTFFPRRAPVGFYMEYALGKARSWIHTLQGPFYTFSETLPVRKHA
jgi:predicted ATPase